MNYQPPLGFNAPTVHKHASHSKRIAFCCVFIISGTFTLMCTHADEQPSTSFQFVQICDTQLGFGTVSYETDVASLRQAVQQINAMKPDFVVICGDLVNKPEPKAFADFKDLRAQFTVPCHCAPGNHDIGHPLNTSLLANYRKTIGKDYFQFKNKGCTFVIVNTQLWKSPVDPETAQQDTWFVKTLDEAKRRNSPVFVVGHHPLFLKSADEPEEYFNIPLERRTQLLAMFRDHGVVAMLTGHTHKLVTNTQHGIQFVSGETTCNNFDKRPLGFRVWTVDSRQQVSHRFVALEKTLEK